MKLKKHLNSKHDLSTLIVLDTDWLMSDLVYDQITQHFSHIYVNPIPSLLRTMSNDLDQTMNNYKRMIRIKSEYLNENSR